MTQPALFALPPAKRVELDPSSWVETLSGWLRDPDTVFAHMLAAVPWVQRERRMFERMLLEPRLTAEVGRIEDAPHPSLIDAANALSELYGVRYDHLWLNLYRDERDSTAWHGDRISCRRDECVVPVLTLGATRRFLLKPRAGGRSIAFAPAAGDLVVMGGRCQRNWVHCLPKSADPCGARISVNFQSYEQATRKR